LAGLAVHDWISDGGNFLFINLYNFIQQVNKQSCHDHREMTLAIISDDELADISRAIKRNEDFDILIKILEENNFFVEHGQALKSRINYV